jgi:4-hydroxy-tetrahydrodipicolinate synthase
MHWYGVMPAITTPFRPEGGIDHEFLARHASWLAENGATGLVPLGSLGEGASLTGEEKRAVLETCVKAVGGSIPVVAGVAAASTDAAVSLARLAHEVGCGGLMVLPPYVYSSDWMEMRAHLSAVITATPLSCMLYNNPIAYRTDFLPEQVEELVLAHGNLHAMKESSGDVRRVTAVRERLGDRIAIFAGLDDLIVECAHVGATGWIAGLVNALPRESVRLFDLSQSGPSPELDALYHWFLPLLRLDTVPKFVQLIKLVQSEVGMGSECVRPPRLELVGEERAAALATIHAALERRPNL